MKTPRTPLLSPILVALLALVAFPGARILAQPAQDGAPDPSPDGAEQANAPARPRLVVLLAIDQLIPEQLVRLRPGFTGGLARLLAEGVSVEGAELPYAHTETGPGHVTFGTGCLPRTHGVTGNTIWSRVDGHSIYCVEDPRAREVSMEGVDFERGQRSPRNLRVATFAERVQARFDGAKVCSISAKDRAAIGMAGDVDGTVLWWDKSRSAGFVSSTAYMDELPRFVRLWNQDWTGRGRAFVWTDTSPVGDDPEGAHERFGSAPDDREGERPRGASGVTFPYPTPADMAETSLGGYLYDTPATDGYVAELGIAAIDALQLGRDDAPDVLCLSFSACDVIGHSNGPYSREVTDTLFRVDRHLGRLFDELDDRVGEGRWVAALTADHGVLPLPESLAARGEEGRRVDRKERGDLLRALSSRLEERFGARVTLRSAPGGYAVDERTFEGVDATRAEVRLAVAEELRALREDFPWIEAAFAYDELALLGPGSEGLQRLLWNGLDLARCPDVEVIDAPGVLVGLQNGTSHGSPHGYDREIPLLFLGPGTERIAPPEGRAAGSHDAAPTLIDLLGIDPAQGFDGESLLWK